MAYFNSDLHKLSLLYEDIVLSPAEKLIAARFNLRNKYPMFEPTLEAMTYNPASQGCETLAVDADGNMVYNEQYVDSLTKEALMGVLMHEAWHVMMNHLRRRNMAKPTIWNWACDLVINYIIQTEDMQLPDTDFLPDKETGIWECADPNDPANMDVKHKPGTKHRGKTIQISIVNQNGGVLSAEEVYNRLSEIFKDDPNPPPPKQGPPRQLKVGDVVWNEDSKQYGRVESINNNTGEIVVDEMTEDQVYKHFGVDKT